MDNHRSMPVYTRLRHLLTFDRVVLAGAATTATVLALFLYYLSNTHEANCDPYYLGTAKLLFNVLAVVPTATCVYTIMRLCYTGGEKPTNGRLLTALGLSLLVGIVAGLLYVVIGFVLFFGVHC
jgi:hypothetical protein